MPNDARHPDQTGAVGDRGETEPWRGICVLIGMVAERACQAAFTAGIEGLVGAIGALALSSAEPSIGDAKHCSSGWSGGSAGNQQEPNLAKEVIALHRDPAVYVGRDQSLHLCRRGETLD